MRYKSTRDSGIRVTAAEAIARGLSPDGGLFLPETLPALTKDMIQNMIPMRYSERAAFILGIFLEGFSGEELSEYAEKAYATAEHSPPSSVAHSARGFSHPSVAPLHKIDSGTFFLELWHGPTCAFKDMALQMLPYLLSASLKKTNENREVCILVATSGDTGKAALEGFSGVAGTRIMVFYPKDGVSEVQKLQMITQGGGNVYVVAVEGNFDDTQTGVKAIFSDEKLRAQLNERGFFLSSANSINWGRLVPQIVYYVSAYCDLISAHEINNGEKINFCVPTGNFGNILAAWYAEKMGLPVGKLICASNRNDVLTQFINTGAYDRNRPFYTTISPSMDILVSSNLERLLFEISGKDSGAVSEYMSALAKTGRYTVANKLRDEVGRIFAGSCCSEEDTKQTIADVFGRYNYLIDTHTAVGYKALSDYRAAAHDETPTVVVSTASPFKFCENVLAALGIDSNATGAALLSVLSNATGCPIPEPLASLADKEPRFTESVAFTGMQDAVLRFLA